MLLPLIPPIECSALPTKLRVCQHRPIADRRSTFSTSLTLVILDLGMQSDPRKDQLPGSHDALTELPNRAVLDQHLDLIESARQILKPFPPKCNLSN